jgi:hypothetical protein
MAKIYSVRAHLPSRIASKQNKDEHYFLPVPFSTKFFAIKNTTRIRSK